MLCFDSIYKFAFLREVVQELCNSSNVLFLADIRNTNSDVSLVLLASCYLCLRVLLPNLVTPQIVSSFLFHVAFSLFLFLLYLYFDIRISN